MFRRSFTLARQGFNSSQNLLRNNSRTYATQAQQAEKKTNWKKIALWSAAFIYFTPGLYAYYVLGYNTDTLYAEAAQAYRLLNFLQQEKEKDVENKMSSFDFLKKFYAQEKLSSFDLSKYPSFSASNKSLLRKYMDEDTFNELKPLKTSTGFGLDSIIRSGVYNHNAGIGVYLPDVESYSTFAPLVNKIIQDYHQGYDPVESLHQQDFNPSHLRGSNPDPEGKYIISTRIRVGRNLEGYPLPTGQSRKDRQDIERKVVGALQSLTGELEGKYYPLSFMTEEDRLQLVNDHFLFKNNDKHLETAGAYRDWPEGRGIFHSADKRFLVWVNEEDELRIISMQMGGDVRQVFERLSSAVGTLERRLKFQFDDHLGYISSCPTNLGTAMRASVHIKIPLVSQQPGFKKWCEEHGLSVRGIHGEHTESEGGVYDISNKRRLGLSEVDCVQTMYDGVRDLIAWEKQLEAKQATKKEQQA